MNNNTPIMRKPWPFLLLGLVAWINVFALFPPLAYCLIMTLRNKCISTPADWSERLTWACLAFYILTVEF